MSQDYSSISADDYLSADAKGTMANSVLVGASSNPLITGLLSGVRWAGNNITLTVAAPAQSFSYTAAEMEGNEGATFQPVTPAQINAFNWALRLISDYANISFTPGFDNSANIRVANAQGQSHGYYPSGIPAMGDIWMGDMNNADAGPITNPQVGDFNFATHLHELGHALGLKHGQDTGGPQTQGNGTVIPRYAPLPAAFDNWNWSLMTYHAFPGAQGNNVQGDFTSDNPMTYMPADILALQHMYGARYNGSSAGNTTYRWDTNGFFSINGALPVELNNQPAKDGRVLMTIWDGGGNDTYDFSLFGANQTISLLPGAFSTFNPAQLADLNGGAAVSRALGNVANAFMFNSDTRSLIENAIAGSGNDTMTGNGLNNRLEGRGGNDTIFGNNGADVLLGGGANDHIYGGVGNDNIDGGPGYDFARYDFATTGVQARLDNPAANSGEAAGDTMYNFEGLVGSQIGDILVGNNLALGNQIYGLGGPDSIYGLGGPDTFFSGAGNDTIFTGPGTDTIFIPAADRINTQLDRVTDFTDGQDILRFQGIAQASATLIDSQGGTLIQISIPGGGGYQVFLYSISVAQASDQIFFT